MPTVRDQSTIEWDAPAPVSGLTVTGYRAVVREGTTQVAETLLPATPNSTTVAAIKGAAPEKTNLSFVLYTQANNGKESQSTSSFSLFINNDTPNAATNVRIGTV